MGLLPGVLLVLAAAASALERPPYFKPCSRNDPNLDECTLKSGIEAIPHLIKGDPKYRIPVLKPLKVTEVRVEDADKGNAPTGLNIIMKDLEVWGLDTAELKKARFDLKNKKIEVVLRFPDLRLQFQHEVYGKFLVFAIRGKGDGTFNMTDVGITYLLDYHLATKKDGLEYMQAGESSMVHTVKHISIHLDNLFNGDKALGDSTNVVLNENWQVANKDLGPYIAQGIGEAIRQILVSCMDLMPYSVLFPETV